MGLFLVLGLLQGDNLAFGEDQAILGDFGFPGLQAALEGLEVMAQPDAADPARGDEEAPLAEFVGEADLAPGGLVERELGYGWLDGGVHAVLDERLAFGDLPQGFFAAGLIELLKAVEAVAGVAQDLAGLGDVAQLSGQFE